MANHNLELSTHTVDAVQEVVTKKLKESIQLMAGDQFKLELGAAELSEVVPVGKCWDVRIAVNITVHEPQGE